MSQVRILIAEDNAIIAEQLRHVLIRLGYEVLEPVATGEDAISACQNASPHIILMDVKLKGSLNGIEVAKQIRNYSDVPIIYLTAYSDNGLIQEAKDTKPHGYLVKPIHERELVATIEMALSRHTFGTELEEQIQARTAELTRINEMLLESQRQQRALLDSIPDIAWLKDKEMRFIAVNQPFATACNQPVEKLPGMTDFDIWPSEFAELYRAVDREVMDSRQPKRVEEPLHTISGDQQWVETIKVPIIDEKGEVRGTVGIARDITDRKKHEDALQQQRAALEQLVQERTVALEKANEELLKISKLQSIATLAGGLAHDFNNFLTAIVGNVSLAERACQKDSKVSNYLKNVEEACIQARNLTKQLLTFATGGSPVKEFVKLCAFLEDWIRFVLTGSNYAYKFECLEKLWPTEVDEGQISQVVSNLVLNAGQAMPDGGTMYIAASNCTLDLKQIEELAIPISEGVYVKIVVRDEGIGIEPEIRDRIFDPFFSTREKGTGLGLSSAFSIVRAHGGYIHVTSELGKGSIFTVYLPAKPDAVVKELEVRAEVPMPKARILVMEDEPLVRETLVALLETLGHQVVAVKQGAEAVEEYEKANNSSDPFDVVILDLTIRGGFGGKQTIERLKVINPSVRAIASSGYSNDPIMSDHESHGFAGRLAKPYRLRELQEVLSAVLNNE